VKMARSYVLPLIVALCLAMLAAAPVLAAPQPGELSFSASLFSPNDGGASWSARGEYLIPFSHFYFGPSVSLFDGPG